MGNHRAERELDPASAASSSRGPATARRQGRHEDAPERVDGAGRDQRVAVQQQHQLAAGGANADVVCGGEADVLRLHEHGDRRPAGADSIRAAILRRVVDDHDFIRGGRRGSRHRVDAGDEIVTRIEADDDDRERDRHGGAIARSMPASVSSAARSQE